MPRFALVRFKGQPTKERPAGMNDILGMSEYANPKNAIRYMAPQPDRVRALKAQGFTHLGVYNVPTRYSDPDVLVQTLVL